MPFKNDVKTPARIIIIPCPIEKRKSIKEASTRFFDKTAKLIIPARTGVEQGLEESAKIIPIIKGYINKPALSFLGIFLITEAKLISIMPSKFSPKTIIKEARKRMKYTPANDAKTCPVRAQIIPITVKTIPSPNTKEQS